jgi:hypothetical protein
MQNQEIINKSHNTNFLIMKPLPPPEWFTCQHRPTNCLKSLERAIVKPVLFIELPIGIEAQVRPRSGLAAKNGSQFLTHQEQSMPITEEKLV